MTPTEEPHPTPSSPSSPETELPDDLDALMEAETTRSLGKENRQVLILVGIVATFMVLAHFTPLKAWLTNIQTWKTFVDELGWAGHAAFVGACALGVMIGLPRLPLCATAGLIFGFVEGLSLSLMGSVMGSYGAFFMTRRGARRAILARADQWPWLRRMLEKPSLLRVFWVRQMMLPGLVLNVLLGVTTVRHGTFLLGTLLGYLPLNLAFTLVGSGLGKGNLAQSLAQLLGALAVVNFVGWIVWRLLKRRPSSPSPHA